MATLSTTNVESRILAWGNALGLRITKPMAESAGLKADTPVVVSTQPGRIVIETYQPRPSLDAMLAAFDPKRHGGEVMAFKPVGAEVL